MGWRNLQCKRQQDTKAQFRVLKLAIEEDYNTTLNKDHQLLPWIMRAASAALSRGSIGRDGKTPSERLHGHKYRRQLPPIAETCMYKIRDGDASRADPRWLKGIFLGTVCKSNELYMGTATGVVKKRSVRRLAEHEQQDTELLHSIKGIPWMLNLHEVKHDTIVLPGAIVEGADLPPRAPRAETESRRVYLRANVELREFGYTLNCGGCDAARAGLTRSLIGRCLWGDIRQHHWEAIGCKLSWLPQRGVKMEFLHQLKAYSYDTMQTCWQRTGRKPVPVKWVDIDKGEPCNPKIRSRLVVQETRFHSTITDEAQTFAATPPVECLRMMISMLMTPR
eukprot:3886384-Amphidinium_carterae.3